MVNYRTILGRFAASVRNAFSRNGANGSTEAPAQQRTNGNGSSVRLFVGNLPYVIDNDRLRSLFETYGPVDSAAVITDRITGESRGFGFVEITSKSDARTAITAMNGKEIMGRSITVDEAHSKPQRSDDRNTAPAAPRRDNSRRRSRNPQSNGNRTQRPAELERRSR